MSQYHFVIGEAHAGICYEQWLSIGTILNRAEHMEEDDEESKTVPPWVYLEYRQMTAIAGSQSSVLFTHLSPSSKKALDSELASVPSGSNFEVHTAGVLDVMRQQGVNLDDVCLLDPKAEQALSPEDGEKFQWFLFGVRPVYSLSHAMSYGRGFRIPRGFLVLVSTDCDNEYD
ncbi:hypothetical protein FRC12_005983 [Ceratobasidium sp. 428]|nr:hypothetical protein FRC12_005983 [Ceratobasidium sp. 428]